MKHFFHFIPSAYCNFIYSSGSVVCAFKLKMAAQVTSDDHVVTEMALQSTMRTGFDVLARTEQLTWPVIKVTIEGTIM